MNQADLERYYAIHERKKAIDAQFTVWPGVVGIDIGYKKVKGRQTEEMAILVCVKEKGKFDPANRIPSRIEGISTDVIEREIVLLDSDLPPDHLDTIATDIKYYNPLQPGCSIITMRGKSGYMGTLGALVMDNGTQDRLYLGSYHIFCVTPNWRQLPNKSIIQPAGGGEIDSIGEVDRGVWGETAGDLYVDVATCRLMRRRDYSANIVQIGSPTGFVEPSEKMVGQSVSKYGCMTLLTTGQITSQDFTFYLKETWFYEQIYIAQLNFCAEGDSGAVVVDKQRRAVGMIMGGEKQGKNMVSAVLNPMWMVCLALNVSLVL